jgi:hypothetical protein
VAVKAFEDTYEAKFPKAVAKITDDVEELLAFYDYPCEHWVHLRTTNENVNCRVWLGCARGLLPRPQLPDIAARSRGQGTAPGWTNDLDRGEDRGSVGLWRAQLTAKRRAGRGTGSPAALLSLRA